jgi:hypothetical protein
MILSQLISKNWLAMSASLPLLQVYARVSLNGLLDSAEKQNEELSQNMRQLL